MFGVFVGYIRCSGARQWASVLAMDLCKLVGLNVRRLRLAARVTQEELAHRTGLDRTYVSDVERGIGNPSVRWLQDVATALSIHPILLLAEDDKAPLIEAVLAGDPAPGAI